MEAVEVEEDEVLEVLEVKSEDVKAHLSKTAKKERFKMQLGLSST